MQQYEKDISVVMPVYNGDAYIAEAIQSVLNQSFENFELLIIDDGSTDNTNNIINEFKDERIVLISQPHSGIAAALNNGIAKSKGKYIARFDADDICYANRLQIQYEFLEMYKEYDIVGSSADYVSEPGEFVFRYDPPGFSNREIQAVQQAVCPFVHSSVMIRKTCLEKRFYNSDAFGFEDHLLWVQLLPFSKAFNIKTPLIKVRLNTASATIDERWQSRAYVDVKRKVLAQKNITEEDGKLLAAYMQSTNNRIKQAAYFELIGKKYLWNNFQPVAARKNLKNAIASAPYKLRNYCLYGFSFLPGSSVRRLYKLFKTN